MCTHRLNVFTPRAAKTNLDEILTVLAAQKPRTCFTVLVLANKQDVPGAKSPADVERVLDLPSRYLFDDFVFDAARFLSRGGSSEGYQNNEKGHAAATLFDILHVILDT